VDKAFTETTYFCDDCKVKRALKAAAARHKKLAKKD
jgi:hypothetical protein